MKKPSGRREIAELLTWIDLMVNNILSKKDKSIK